jgi:sugar/nucleoside kinase (ribokinase family)
MALLVVGSLALDDVETPFGKREQALGGAAVYFGIAASYFTPVRIVGVISHDFPQEHIDLLSDRGIDLGGLTVEEGGSFRYGCRYGYDLNARETLFTDLNVFADFNPKIPASFQESRGVFLANISPELQLRVLEQVDRPEVVALDTMNYWIERTPEDLQRVLSRIQILLINDSEARELADDPNLSRAATRILQMGPEMLVVKKGEHGALLFSHDRVFAVPGLPMETIIDPTGAGDAFAGGFLGYVMASGELTHDVLRQATIYGSAMGSFCCEAFSVERLASLTNQEIDDRFQDFKQLTHFDAGSTIENG